MEKSLTAAQEYEKRARREIEEARVHLTNNFLECAISTAYYSCFYAVHSQLARIGVSVSSHKQVGIEFRRCFIKTKILHPQLSETWQRLSEERLEADYLPAPSITSQEAEKLVKLAEEFVREVLAADLPESL